MLEPQLGDVLAFDLKIILSEMVVAVNHPTVVVVDGRAVGLFDPEINVLRRGVRRLVHLKQAAAVNSWTWTEVGSVADEITAVTVNPAESQEIWIFSSAIAMVVEGLPFTTAVKLAVFSSSIGSTPRWMLWSKCHQGTTERS